MRALVVVVIVIGVACTRGEETVGRDPTLTKTSAASTTAASTPTASAAPSGGLPPIDTTCASDGDCDYLYAYLIVGKCCKGTCSPKAASRTYIAKVDALCHDTLGYEFDTCPMKKCVAPGALKCDGGHCKIVTPLTP